MVWPEAIRDFVRARARGRCEYCLLDQSDAGFSHEVDHIRSRKHGGTDDLDNVAYACFLCNRYKGADVASIDPATGELIRLFHPRLDVWDQHFRLAAARIEPLTGIGRVTVRLLRFNLPARVLEREFLERLGRYRIG